MDNRSKVQQTLEQLNSLGIQYRYAEHPPIYTIAETIALGLDNGDEIAKNLFLRDSKKKHYFLVLIDQSKTANLKALSEALGVKGLTFASEEDLMKYLSLEKGSVTPLGILNDEERRVTVVLDEKVLSFESIGMHPNANTSSVWLKPDDLIRVIEHHGSKIIRMEL